MSAWIKLVKLNYQSASGFVSDADFREDITRIKTLVRMCGRWVSNTAVKDINVHVLINHMVILKNVLPSNIIVAVMAQVCNHNTARPMNSLMIALGITDIGETDERMDAEIQKILTNCSK